MKIQFIKSKEKKEIIERLEKQFGITDLPYLLIESGKEKLRAFSGHLSKEEILELGNLVNIELMGFYLGKLEAQGLRLSFDAPIILRDQVKNNIVEINQEQFDLWIRGSDLEIPAVYGMVLIKFGSDFVGCGISNEKKIFNYVPKDKRLKNKINPKII